jgi:hypothetical protein
MAHACALDPFAVSRAIAQLVERAFAKRRAARADRRFAAVTVMACGRAVFDEIAALGRLIETELCAALSAAERARFNRAQTRGRERASRWRACRRARRARCDDGAVFRRDGAALGRGRIGDRDANGHHPGAMVARRADGRWRPSSCWPMGAPAAPRSGLSHDLVLVRGPGLVVLCASCHWFL